MGNLKLTLWYVDPNGLVLFFIWWKNIGGVNLNLNVKTKYWLSDNGLCTQITIHWRSYIIKSILWYINVRKIEQGSQSFKAPGKNSDSVKKTI